MTLDGDVLIPIDPHEKYVVWEEGPTIGHVIRTFGGSCELNLRDDPSTIWVRLSQTAPAFDPPHRVHVIGSGDPGTLGNKYQEFAGNSLVEFDDTPTVFVWAPDATLEEI